MHTTLASRLPATLLVAIALAAAPSPGHAQEAPPRHPIDDAPAQLRELVPFVEEACGAAFKRPPVVVTLPAREAAQAFKEDLRPEIERKYATATDGQKAALLDASARASVASCLARYSFSRHSIVLVKDSFDRQRRGAGFSDDEAHDLLRSVLCHEAVHALDDARFDLTAFYAGAADEEALRARAMIAEGRAVHFGRRAAAAAGVPERARDLLPGGDQPRDVHTWMLRMTYELGASFAAALEERSDGLAERVFATPPALTLHVSHPPLWPATAEDDRPAALLARALPDATPRPLSDLQLRARYASLHGRAASDATFEPYRGGAQCLVDDTNVAVLAFASDEAAARYTELAATEAPTERRGSLVLRAFGPAAADLVVRLTAAATADKPR